MPSRIQLSGSFWAIFGQFWPILLPPGFPAAFGKQNRSRGTEIEGLDMVYSNAVFFNSHAYQQHHGKGVEGGYSSPSTRTFLAARCVGGKSLSGAHGARMFLGKGTPLLVPETFLRTVTPSPPHQVHSLCAASRKKSWKNQNLW